MAITSPPNGKSPRLPSWAPPLTPLPPNRAPELLPPLTALRYVFSWAYLTLPASVWALPPRQQSDAVIRAVCAACRCYTPGCRGFDYMAADPDKHLAEYLTIRALASVDVDDFLRDLNADCASGPFPASAYDPDGREGQWPSPEGRA
jgi:hypothetical protein